MQGWYIGVFDVPGSKEIPPVPSWGARQANQKVPRKEVSAQERAPGKNLV